MSENEEFKIAIVDRIEEGIAVLEVIEPQFTFQLPVAVLPDDLHEGAAVELNFRLRPEVEKKRRKKIRNLQQKLLDRSEDSDD